MGLISQVIISIPGRFLCDRKIIGGSSRSSGSRITTPTRSRSTTWPCSRASSSFAAGERFTDRVAREEQVNTLGYMRLKG